jgi:hypothetical protein
MLKCLKASLESPSMQLSVLSGCLQDRHRGFGDELRAEALNLWPRIMLHKSPK